MQDYEEDDAGFLSKTQPVNVRDAKSGLEAYVGMESPSSTDQRLFSSLLSSSIMIFLFFILLFFAMLFLSLRFFPSLHLFLCCLLALNLSVLH